MLSTALRIALAWLPFYGLWALFVLSYADATLGDALFGSAVTIGTAAVLGMGVWWLTGRFEWPDRVRLGFYALHAFWASAWSMAWFLGSSLVLGLVTWTPPEFRFWEWEDIGWRFLMGLWLYGLVAGVSYAIRIRRSLFEQQRAAARLEALATTARLDSLRARLNPHFLFNALNSVSALVVDDPRAAEDAIERLAILLRYSLEPGEGDVPLDREMGFVRDYLSLESLRLGDRLGVDIRVDPGTDGARVPPFSIQTLVENAIRHGIAPKEDGGTLRVRVGEEGTALVVVVEDDGRGLDPAAHDASTGTGLRNLRERLVGRFGTRASLDVAPRQPQGCVARLVLPLEATS